MTTQHIAECKVCGHTVKVIEATERQTYRSGYDYAPGRYYVGTCPACQVRDCYHHTDTTEDTGEGL